MSIKKEEKVKDMEVKEIEAEETFFGQAMRFAPNVAFYSLVAIFFPWLIQNRVHIGVFLGAASFFTILSSLVPFLTEKLFAKKLEKQRLEMENRIVSLAFNISTGLPSCLVYLDLFPLVNWTEIEEGQTFIMDVFNAWSMGYIFYDFLTLTKIYGKGASLIQWHHVGEALVCYTYVIHPELGSLYLLGGGCMQLSSGVLHVQRIAMFFSTKQNLFLIVWKWILTISWAHSRLYIFPYCIYLVYINNELGFMHLLLLVTGTVLTIMNAHWLYKIINMKSLAF